MKKPQEMSLNSLIYRKTKCKYTSACNLYSNASYTCTHTGGTYCGKYRKLNHRAENVGIQTNPVFIEIPQ
jgi:hypothetical protein